MILILVAILCASSALVHLPIYMKHLSQALARFIIDYPNASVDDVLIGGYQYVVRASDFNLQFTDDETIVNGYR